VVDYFALFGESRRPWLDPDQLKAKFIALSQEIHPDRTHGSSAEEKQRAQDRYTELNRAYQTLREPKDRLAHLLELETGLKPTAIQTAPEELMKVFLQIGTVCRETDQFIEHKKTVTSPLLQVDLFGRAQELTARIQQLQQDVRRRTNDAERALRLFEDGRKDDVDTASRRRAELEESYRTFSYLTRWNAQLQERLVQLAL